MTAAAPSQSESELEGLEPEQKVSGGGDRCGRRKGQAAQSPLHSPSSYTWVFTIPHIPPHSPGKPPPLPNEPLGPRAGDGFSLEPGAKAGTEAPASNPKERLFFPPPCGWGRTSTWI